MNDHCEVLRLTKLNQHDFGVLSDIMRHFRVHHTTNMTYLTHMVYFTCKRSDDCHSAVDNVTFLWQTAIFGPPEILKLLT
jgi:uncharacterized protein (DUF1810 family)